MHETENDHAQTDSENLNLLMERANRLRHAILNNEFRCLNSLLFEIGLILGVDEVGLVEFSNTRIPKATYVRRIQPNRASVGKIDEHRMTEYIQELLDIHLESIDKNPFREVTIEKWDAEQWRLYPSKKLRRNLVMYPVWPSDQPTERKPADSFYFVYHLNPVALEPDRLYAANLEGNLLPIYNLCAEWFAWKHRKLSMRNKPLAGRRRLPVVEVLKSTLIRPFEPPAFSSVLDKLCIGVELGSRRGPRFGHQWWKEACELLDASSDCASNSIIRCHGCNRQSYCPQNLQQDRQGPRARYAICPQSSQLNSKLKTISRLKLWSTFFWREPEGAIGDTSETLREAIAGLRAAVPLLDQHWGEALDLHYGRDRQLLRFFLSRAIYETLEDGRFKLAVPAKHHMEVMARQAQLAVLLLVKKEWTEDDIENLIEVMADYGHELLGIGSRLKAKPDDKPYFHLAYHLHRTLRGESALHTLKAWYRDHFFHTVEVCLIGFALLRSHPDKSKPKESLADVLISRGLSLAPSGGKKPKPRTHVPEDQREFMAQWWMAALAHDTAYSIDVLGGTLSLLERFNTAPQVGEFAKEVRATVEKLSRALVSPAATAVPKLGELADELRAIVDEAQGYEAKRASSLLAELCEKIRAIVNSLSRAGTIPAAASTPKLGELAVELRSALEVVKGNEAKKAMSFLKGDHGVIAASDLAELLPQVDTKRDYSAAIRAIAFHNNKQPKISAAKDPVAALLVLCDTIQDWGRSQLGFKHSPAKMLSRIVSSSPAPKDEQFGPVVRFSFDINPRSLAPDRPHCQDWATLNRLILQLDYSKKARDGYGIYYGWVDLVHNFRRVNFSEWMPIEVCVRQRYPMSSASQPLKLDEFDSIARGSRDLESFFAMAKQGSRSQPVCSTTEQATPDDGCEWWEVMEFNLSALSSCPNLLGEAPAVLSQALENWDKKNRSGEGEFIE